MYARVQVRILQAHILVGNQQGYKYIGLDYSAYHITILINNSYFHIMDRTAFEIKNRYSLYTVQKFLLQTVHSNQLMLKMPFNKNIHFINCHFYDNKELIRISVQLCKTHACFSSIKLPVILTNICFIRCDFINNRVSHGLITFENRVTHLGKIPKHFS